MSTHEGLPVAGYQPQSDERVALVNGYKLIEERILREIEAQRSRGMLDPRLAALAFTGIQEAFMWLNRAVFKPGRVALPEDDTKG